MRKNQGNVAVEFALLLPVITLVILLIVDAGRFFFVATQLNLASQEAARAESLGLSAQVPSISSSVLGTALNVASRSGAAVTPTVVQTACTGSPRLASVKVSLRFEWVTPVDAILLGGPGVDHRTMSAKGVRLCPG